MGYIISHLISLDMDVQYSQRNKQLYQLLLYIIYRITVYSERIFNSLMLNFQYLYTKVISVYSSVRLVYGIGGGGEDPFSNFYLQLLQLSFVTNA